MGRSAIIGVLLLAVALTTGVIIDQVPSSPTKQKSASIAADEANRSLVNNPVEFGNEEFPANFISGTVFLASGQPAADAKLHIVGHRLSGIDARLNTDSMGRFEFVVHFKTEALGQLRFAAETTDGSEVAFHRFAWEPEELVTKGISIKLQPIRIAEVEVVDGEGQPIGGAQVAVQFAYPNILEGSETDASGKSSVKLPMTERIETILAWKDHAGLDYKLYTLNRFERADIKAVPPEFPSEGPERLVLDGAQPMTVALVDGTDGAPIEGAEVYPWLLNKDQASEGLNFSFFTELIAQTTSQDGTTAFAWMPTWQKTPVTFWSSAKGYERPRGNYAPVKDQGVLRLAVNRLVSIRGEVVDSNDQPVEGAEISAHGKGRGMNDFQTFTRTNRDGMYELEIAPNHNYLLTAKDEHRVSAPHTGLVVSPNTPLVNRDFKLRAPTRVHGRLLNERTQDPIPNARVIVYHYGTELMDISDADIPNPDNEPWTVRPIIQHYATTDADGKFEFMLGDGSFDLRPPQQEKTEKFEISGQSELEFAVTTKVHAEVELVGLVVAKADGLPIKAARVEGVPRNFGSMYWTATADDDGKFKVLRRQEPTYVLAKNEEKTLASIVEVRDLNRTFIIQLESVGNARGRLVNKDGQSIVGQRINFSVDVPDVDNDTFSPRFGGHVVTDDNGEFRLESLVANWEYKITFPSTPEGTIPRLTKVTVKPGESLELGNLTEPAP